MTDNEKKVLERYLNDIIDEALFAPAGDPGYENLVIAAKSYECLELFGLTIEAKDDVFLVLTKNNIGDRNFLK